MEVAPLPGVRLDPDRIDYETARRGLNQRQLAARAGLPETRLSRARHGHAISQGTLRKITEALLTTPIMLGGDLLLVAPETKVAVGGSSPTATQEDRNGRGLQPV